MKSVFTSEYANFIKTLSAVRKANGLSQQQVADALGKPQSFVSKYESGERRLDVVEFIGICRALAVDPVQILADSGLI